VHIQDDLDMEHLMIELMTIQEVDEVGMEVVSNKIDMEVEVLTMF